MAFSTSRKTLARLRLAAQRIYPRAEHPSVADVVRHSLAMQAQDFWGATWSVGLRRPGSTEQDVLNALATGEIVRSWPMRGTLHFTAPEDLGWMLSITTPRLMRGVTKRREQLGLTDAEVEKAREVAIAALSGGRVLSREAMHTEFEANGISTASQRGYHLLWSLSQTGTLVFGPTDGKVQTFTLLDEWVTARRVLDREAALAEFARRYFTSHGPATIKDLAWWGSLTMGEAREGLAAAREELEQIEVEGETYFLAAGLEPATSSVQLLPGFDEYLLGYQNRSAALAPEHFAAVVPGNNGIFMPTVVDGGEVVGMWKKQSRAKRTDITLQPLGTIPTEKRLAPAVAALETFLERPVVVATPSPEAT